MICPGVNLPPPIAAELEGGREALEDGLGEECGGVAAGEGDLGVEGGAMVAPPKLGECSTRVANALESMGAPQLGQNFAESDTGSWQDAHRMANGDSTTAPRHRWAYRTLRARSAWRSR